jgi:hypothetical protein
VEPPALASSSISKPKKTTSPKQVNLVSLLLYVATDTKPSTGRRWLASDLRNKSFNDLHKLWYVLLKERNMLKTEMSLARTSGQRMKNPSRRQKVLLSPACGFHERAALFFNVIFVM